MARNNMAVSECALLKLNITVSDGNGGKVAKAVTAIGVAGHFAATPTSKRKYEITHIPTGLRIPFDVSFPPGKALKMLAGVADIVIMSDLSNATTVMETLCARFPSVTKELSKRLSGTVTINTEYHTMARRVANNYEV